MASTRVIKKYPNRRLYDTEVSSYITIEDVRHLIVDGEDFEVRDARSGEDLTRQVLLQIIAEHEQDGEPVLSLAGFSFGAFVTTHAFGRLHPLRRIEKLVLVGTSVSRAAAATIDAAAHDRTLVVHGEQDDTVLLADVMDWARPQALPVTVMPGVGHFFHGQLPLLKNLVVRHLASPSV